jgi:DNA-binding beta-propeller fold protein YncE
MESKFLYRFLFLGCLTVMFASCSRHISKTSGQSEAIIYPAPPDTARIQFLTSFSSSVNSVGKTSVFKKFVMGEPSPKPINKPYGIAIKKGKIYICDTGLGGLEIIDLDKNKFEYFVPKGKGQLKLPLNCFVDDEENLYVTDGERLQVVVFDRNGNFLDAFGETEKFKPIDVFVQDNKVWVSNSKNNSILVYNKGTYGLLYSFPSYANGEEGYIYTPTNIFVTGSDVFVSDMGDFKVKKYDHEGKFLSSVGSNGANVGQFTRPKGIAVDHDGNLFVVDAGFENTQIFDKEGRILMFFGGPYKGPGDNWLPAKVIIDYDNLKYFQKYVDPEYNLRYLVFVTNQYGPDKVNVYGSIELKK